MVVTVPCLHASIAGGAMGILFPLHAIPLLCLGLVAWAVATRRMSAWLRRGTLAAILLMTCGAFVLLRTEGVSGSGGSAFRWGFAGSPLVIDDVVVVAAAGRLTAYDAGKGDLRWIGPARGGSYSSPQRWSAGGVPQVLLMSDAGVTSVAPATGAVIWEHAWPGAAIVQPTPVGDHGLLIATASASGGVGIRRLAVAGGSGGEWTVEERWTSTGLKPYFNDLVSHGGHAYGFDGGILACVDLRDGKRAWKGGRYGHGQLVLLADRDALLVLSEEGELALVAAVPDHFRELARMPAIEWKSTAADGRTNCAPAPIGGGRLIVESSFCPSASYPKSGQCRSKGRTKWML